MSFFLSDSSDPRWDTCLSGFEDPDIYYRRRYALLEEQTGGRVFLLYLQTESGQAAEVFKVRDAASAPRLAGRLAPGHYFDAVSVYGYGGPLVQGRVNPEDWHNAWREAAQSLRLNNYFVRFHPVLANDRMDRAFYHARSVGQSAVIPLTDRESLFKGMKSECRNRLRHGLRFPVVDGCEDWMWDSFLEMYHRSMRAKHARAFYDFTPAYFRFLQREMTGETRIFLAMDGTVPVSGALILRGCRQIHYHLAARNPDRTATGAANAVIWRAALWGIEQGYTSFHLGSGLGGSGTDRLMQFKRGFSPSSTVPFVLGHMIFDAAAMERLNRLAQIGEGGYFPLYRTPKE